METNHNDHDYGTFFRDLFTDALQTEESELKTLKANNQTQVRDTIRQYPEQWLWPSFLKKAMTSASCPLLQWERHGRADCCFMSGDDILATFELKMFAPLSVHNNKQWYRDILQDFEKQLLQARQNPSVEHYVILPLYGEDIAAVGDWAGQVLLRDVNRNQDVGVHAIPAGNPIQLNNGSDGVGLVNVFRVTARS